MKAIEYYEKYKEDFETDPKLAADKLREEMMEEVNAIKELRHVKTQEGEQRVIREQSDKWNAIVRIFEKNGGSPIARGGFITDA